MKNSLLACVVLVSSATIFALSAKNSDDGFLARSLDVGGKVYNYRVYLPPHRGLWNAKTKYPVVLFLHGAGERGVDNVMQTKVGIGQVLKEYRLPAIIVFPQCPEKNWWTDPEVDSMALAALEKSIKEFNGDTERTYCTGISMGGYGTWSMASRHPEKFAAIVPICGGIKSLKISWHNLVIPAVSEADDPYLDVAKRITCPVKTFHAKDDDVIPVSEQRGMVRALLSLGRPVHETEYDNMGHHIWDATYKNPDLWKWLFRQHLHDREK